MASRERDIGRAYASGSQKRKKKIQKEEQKKKDAAGCRKITDMFAKPTPVSVNSPAAESEHSDKLKSEDTPKTHLPTTSTPTSTLSHSTSDTMDISIEDFVICECDPNSWPMKISDSLRQSFIAENFSQTLDIDFKKSARVYDDGRTRYLNSSMFFRKLANSETVKRSWMVYSETSGKVYCSACKLFSNQENAFTQGFND